MVLEKGTKLEAINPCIMDDGEGKALTVGKSYRILEVEDNILTIKSDLFDKHTFSIEPDEWDDKPYTFYFKLYGIGDHTEEHF